MGYFNNHCHTCFSNLRLVDSTNKPDELIKKAIEMGMTGICITDHESIGSHVQVNKIAKELRKTNPDFIIGLGNEIYLTETREKGQKYPHHILIAKDSIGHKALRELSSIAWINSYYDRGIERVPLLKEELSSVMKKYKGHVISTTACISNEIGQLALKIISGEAHDDEEIIQESYRRIRDFIEFCVNVFGEDDFYIECAPSAYPDQVAVNKYLFKIAKEFKLKMCVATDAHYLTKEDRYVHKAYLNSKNGEREVDAFYEFARLMDEDEVVELLSLAYDKETIKWIFECGEDMRQKIEFYDLERPQRVVEVPVTDYKKYSFPPKDLVNCPSLANLVCSDNIQERYWINECINALQEKGLFKDDKYLERLEIEAKIIKEIGDRLNCCLFSYFNTFKHYIDLFWECGSIIGPGRGSACGFLSNYLLGITQLDPVKWDLAWWRFLNTGRIGLPERSILGSIKCVNCCSQVSHYKCG